LLYEAGRPSQFCDFRYAGGERKRLISQSQSKALEFTVRETSHSQQLENHIFAALPQNDAHLLTTQ